MALPWRVLRILGQSMKIAAICATALPSALSRRASAMAPARRQERKVKLVQNFRVFKPYLYIHLGLRANWGRRYKIHILGSNSFSWVDLDDFEGLCSYYGSFSNLWSLTHCELPLELYFNYSLIWFTFYKFKIIDYLIVDWLLFDCLHWFSYRFKFWFI